ncbi:glycerophosphodiester phosphodiesterase family protein [Povalibacter sp.]|uniref:glycerophosphodiester phosphodiesterase family protein n=1 Tax=Povalibacter sp. TaxID=1962978 RepID=UPI002F411B5C
MSAAIQQQLPDLIAHRGNAAEYPENTLPALRSALELGVRHIAFDVQLSADRQPMLLHDSTLARTAGLELHALEMSSQELAVVAVNEDRRFNKRFTDIGIPTLAQAVNVLESHPAATAFVQLKRASLRAFGHELVARRVCEVLKPIARQCVLISADLAAVHHLRQVSPYRVGWVLPDYSTVSALKCEALAPDYLFCDHQLLTDNASRLWRGPWRWAIYEVSSRSQALALGKRGARLVQTMLVREMLREFRSLQARV